MYTMKVERYNFSYFNLHIRAVEPQDHKSSFTGKAIAHKTAATVALWHRIFSGLVKQHACRSRKTLWIISMSLLLRVLVVRGDAGQEATVRTGHGTTDWFQIGKGLGQGYILSPCLFNLYMEYIMRNTGLDEAQSGIKIAGRNINNLRYETTPPLWQKAKEN